MKFDQNRGLFVFLRLLNHARGPDCIRNDLETQQSAWTLNVPPRVFQLSPNLRNVALEKPNQQKHQQEKLEKLQNRLQTKPVYATSNNHYWSNHAVGRLLGEQCALLLILIAPCRHGGDCLKSSVLIFANLLLFFALAPVKRGAFLTQCRERERSTFCTTWVLMTRTVPRGDGLLSWPSA